MADPELERFFRENFAIIRAKCARMLGEVEEAADVAQETFARLCESGAIHQAPAERLRWIYVTSTHLAIDLLRRRKLGVVARRQDEADEVGAEPPAHHPHPDGALAARQALAAIAAEAPPEELRVAVLCRLDGLTQPEAAWACAISERTVRRLLGRFDARLAELERRRP